MSTIEAVVNFIGTYPAWAKIAMLAGLGVTCGVALLAPRTAVEAPPQAKTGGSPQAHARSASLQINGINNQGLPRGASVRVTAIVNGKPYVYPSLAGVDWLDVGPTMSSQTFPLDHAPRYDVRFEMELKGSGVSERYVSQETVRIASLPHTGEYRLYPTNVDGAGVSRASVSRASVRYTLEPEQ